jgi:WD40 repeat protein
MKPLVHAALVLAIFATISRPAAAAEPKTVAAPGPVTAVAFSPDGSLLACGIHAPGEPAGYPHGAVVLLDVSKGQKLRVLTGHPGAVACLAFTPDGKILASGGIRQYVATDPDEAQNLKIWDVASGRELATLLGQADEVTCVAFSPDGKTLASGGIDGTVKLRLVEGNWKVRATLKPPTRKTREEPVLSLAFHPNAGWLAVGVGGGTVEIWDLATLKLKQKLRVHDVKNHGVMVALTPDGSTLVAATPQGQVQLRDTESFRIQRTINAGGNVWPLAVSRDGKCMATVAVKADDWNKPCAVTLWELSTGQRIAALVGHQKAVSGVVFSNDGRSMASGSADSTVKLWTLSDVKN